MNQDEIDYEYKQCLINEIRMVRQLLIVLCDSIYENRTAPMSWYEERMESIEDDK